MVCLCFNEVFWLVSEDAKPETAGDDSDMYMEPLEEDHQPASSNYQAAGEW